MQSENWRLAQYAISFGDLHNFWMPAEEYLKLFNAAYLSARLPTEPLDRNNVYLERPSRQFMTWVERLNMLDVIAPWDNKEYPATRAENVKILDEYLTLCEENDIRPIMFLPPQTEVYRKYFNKKLLDEFYYLIGQACKKYPSAIFIDGWKLHGVTDADFYDVWHMNIYGAAKFSTVLNNFIEQLERR